MKFCDICRDYLRHLDKKVNMSVKLRIKRHRSKRQLLIPTLQFQNDVQMIEAIRTGLSKEAAYTISKNYGITIEETGRILGVSARTMQRKSDIENLSPHASDQVVELARLFELGVEVFNDDEKFRQWLRSPIVGLGGQKPLDLLDTSTGIRLVTNELDRIQHGIFS